MDEQPFNFAAAFDTKTVADEGFEFQLMDANDRPTPIWITVHGADSDAYERAQREQRRKFEKRAMRAGRLTLEDLPDAQYELLAAVTIGWRVPSGQLLPDGKPFPAFSKAAAKDLYARYPVIRQQVDLAMKDRANFLPKSAKD
jgi:hypothetical protein